MTAERPDGAGEPRPGIPARRVAVLLAAVGAIGLLMASLVVEIGRDPCLPSALIDRTAPPLAGSTLAGEPFDLADLSGRVRIVNFWASWCIECRREHPDFVRIADRYRGDPVAIVGVIYQDDPDAARAYMREMGGDWPNILDPGGRVAIDYGVAGVPETFLMDAGGVVRAKVIGRIDEGTLRGWIDAALAGTGGSP